MELDKTTDLIKAVAFLAWPVIAAVVLVALFPGIKKIVESRSFSLEVAGMKISVQDAAEQLRAQIEDLQRQVIALRDQGAPKPAGPGAGAVAPLADRGAANGDEDDEDDEDDAAPPPARPPAPAPPPATPRVLWVDDNMSNNAFQIAQLKDQGVTVVQSASTEDAMSILHTSAPFGAVISDMGRREAGRYDARAGLALLQRMRAEQIKTPFIVYTTRDYAQRTATDVRAAGGFGATGSAVELLEWVREKVGSGQHAI
jgi:CheY-like chemotaxis protein